MHPSLYPPPSHFLLLLSHLAERNPIAYQRMRRISLSTYLFGVILMACLFHVSESIEFAEVQMIEKDGLNVFIPPEEVVANTSSESSGETRFLRALNVPPPPLPAVP
jgi:hypothetical protein